MAQGSGQTEQQQQPAPQQQQQQSSGLRGAAEKPRKEIDAVDIAVPSL